MKRKSYSDKLRDPRWQKRRLEILNRSEFHCDNCGDGENELHVHHLVYRKNTEPWEYADKDLSCLCVECHDHFEKLKLELFELLAGFPPEYPIYNLCESLKRLREVDEWLIWDWFNATRYPDLLEEAKNRRREEVEAGNI